MRRSINFILALVLAAACGKETPAPQGNEPSGGNGGSSPSEIESISIPATLEMDVDWADGVPLTVTLSPKGASQDDVAAKVEDESVVSVEKSASGFLVKPKKVGTTKVSVRALKGGASTQTCQVKVNEKGITQATEIESISLSQTAVELADLTESGSAEVALIPLTLSPPNATVNDLRISCSDSKVTAELVAGDPVAIRVSIPANTGHTPTDVRTAKVTVSPRRGGASAGVLSVKVCGHVYGLSLTAPFQYLESGEIHFTYGEKVKLTPNLTKTGTLKSGADKVNYVCPSGITVTDNELYCLSSSNLTGASKSVSLTAQCGLSPTVKLQVHTYATPTDIEINSNLPAELENTYQKGSQYIMNLKVIPETARQRVEVTCSASQDIIVFTPSYLSTQTKLDITAKGVTQNQAYFTLKAGTLTKEWRFHVNEFLPGDIKIGDYVYRTSSGGVRRSDGGLRASGTNWIRQDYVKSNTQSGETLIGIIFDTSPVCMSDIPSDMKAGIKDGYGVTRHVGVLALEDGRISGQYFCNWGDKITSWGTYVPDYTMSNTYKNYTVLSSKGSSVTFNQYLTSFESLVKRPNGSTPWMLPCYIDFQFMGQYGKVLNNNGAGLIGQYWTSSINKTSPDYVGAASWANNACSVSLIHRNGSSKVRPVFFL